MKHFQMEIVTTDTRNVILEYSSKFKHHRDFIGHKSEMLPWILLAIVYVFKDRRKLGG